MKSFGRIVLAAVLLAGAARPAAAVLEQFSFGTDEMVTDSPGMSYDQFLPDVAVTWDAVHVVWIDDREAPEPRVRYARRLAGQGWEYDWVSVSGDSASSARIAASPDGSEVVVVYGAQRTGKSYPHIYCARSLDGGANFTGPSPVNDDEATDWTSHGLPDITRIGSGAYVVVWEDHGYSHYQITADRSLDAGQTWGVDHLASVGPVSASDHNMWPALDSDAAGRVYMVHMNNQVTPTLLLNRSIDGGQTFESEITSLSDQAPSGSHMMFPDVAAWGLGNVVVAWEGNTVRLDTDNDIEAVISHDGWQTFSGGGRGFLASHTTPGAMDGSVRVAADRRGGVYFAFDSYWAGRYHALMACSLDGLAHIYGDWTVDNYVSVGRASEPAIACDPRGNLQLVFQGMSLDTGVPYHILADVGQPAFLDSFEDPDFSAWAVHQGVELATSPAYDPGGTSARFSGTARAPGLLQQNWPVLQQGIVSFAFWDGYGSHPAYLATDWTASLAYDDGTNAGVVRTLGVVNPSSTTHYSTGPAFKAVTGIPRSLGWHEATFVISSAGLEMYLDAEDYPSLNPVLVDPLFTGFADLVFAGGSLVAPYYLDQVVCTVGEAEDSLPALSGAGALLLAVALGMGLRRNRRRAGRR